MPQTRKSSWEWYAVKLLFEAIVTGDPAPETIDEHYDDSFKTLEESIVLIKAQSFEHAYSIAEKKAEKEQFDYLNPYAQKVEWRFARALDCFKLFDEQLRSGTELYSRFLHVPKAAHTEKVIRHYYPETVEDSVVDPNFT